MSADVAMDPVSHLMLGGAMAAVIPRERRARGTTAALVLGSIFPDADIVLAPRWFDLYFLQVHPSLSHAVIWSPVAAMLFACLLGVFVRGASVRNLALAGWVGIIGHVFSDFADGSDIALFAPLSQRQYGWHLFGMAEPFVLVVLAAACFTAWRWPARGRLGALCAFTALACMLAGREMTQRSAAAQYARSVPEAQDHLEIMPVYAGTFAWDIYDQVDNRVRAWRVDARTGGHALLFEQTNAAGPLVDTSRNLPDVRRLLARSTIRVIRMEPEGEHIVVLWSDARMCNARRCDVAFGGVFTPAGVAVAEIIRVGAFEQRRPLPRG